jgi:hypothetical protein
MSLTILFVRGVLGPSSLNILPHHFCLTVLTGTQRNPQCALLRILSWPSNAIIPSGQSKGSIARKEWTPNEVKNWAKSIGGVPDDVVIVLYFTRKKSLVKSYSH